MLVGIIPNHYEERKRRMANRKRNIQMKFYVTENKKRLIDKRIKLLTSLPHSISCSFGNELKDEISIISPVIKHNKVIPLCKSER